MNSNIQPSIHAGPAVAELGTPTVHNPEAVASAAPPMMARRPESLEARIDMLERRIIQECLQRNNYRRKETAAELGISRVTLYNKMKKFGMLSG